MDFEGHHPVVHFGELRLDLFFDPREERQHPLHVALVEVADPEVLQEGHQQLEGELGVGGDLVEVVTQTVDEGRHQHVHALDVPHLRTQVGVGPQHPLDRRKVGFSLAFGEALGDLRPEHVLRNLGLVRGRLLGQQLEGNAAGDPSPTQFQKETRPHSASAD